MINSAPNRTILLIVTFPPESAIVRVIIATVPILSGPAPLIHTCAKFVSRSTGLANISSNPSITIVNVLLVGNGASISIPCATSPPRIALNIHVQKSDVPATQGIRAHIGMKLKLSNIDGIQTFHMAIKSSFIFFL